jgi:hypothetical protein
MFWVREKEPSRIGVPKSGTKARDCSRHEAAAENKIFEKRAKIYREK